MDITILGSILGLMLYVMLVANGWVNEAQVALAARGK